VFVGVVHFGFQPMVWGQNIYRCVDGRAVAEFRGATQLRTQVMESHDALLGSLATQRTDYWTVFAARARNCWSHGAH
jgi:hypothetical protein